MESLSAYARTLIGNMERPNVDKINGLSPVISIEQKTTSKNPRSTVGTLTEIYDFLRLLYARISDPFSHIYGKKMTKQNFETNFQLIAVDSDALSPALQIADRSHSLPLFCDSSFCMCSSIILVQLSFLSWNNFLKKEVNSSGLAISLFFLFC